MSMKSNTCLSCVSDTAAIVSFPVDRDPRRNSSKLIDPLSANHYMYRDQERSPKDHLQLYGAVSGIGWLESGGLRPTISIEVAHQPR
jgi:hypothetical protein